MRFATLCITTFRRPVGLASALAAAERLRIPAGWDIEILVVDNDSSGSGRTVVESAIARGMRVRYVIEPQRGLSPVRNRAWVESSGRDWLIFLDDDEAPAPDWLERIDEAQRASDADVTLGPSIPTYDQEPPRWIRDGGFFERERFATGTQIPYWYARTSGVLIRRAIGAHLGDQPFDPALAFYGGEDRNFFAAIAAAGGTFVWADEAIVVERVPPTRANTGWLVRRAFRMGNSRSVTLLRVENPGVGRRLMRAGRGALVMARGTGSLVAARGAAARVRALQQVATGLGLILGVVGYRYAEYKTTHGS